MMMNKRNFKVGDDVYCPFIGTGVYSLIQCNIAEYPIQIKLGVQFNAFTESGLRVVSDITPAIFLATEENRLTLETLYGVQFEPAPLKGSAKVRQLLKDNKDSRVLCVVSNEGEAAARNFLCIRVIVDYAVSSFEDQFGVSWAYAVPLNEVDTGYLGVHADE